MATELMSPTQSISHQRTSRRIFTALNAFVEKNNLGEMFFAPLDVALPSGTVVRPDIFFLTLRQSICAAAAKCVVDVPPFVVEIMSDETAVRDTLTKRELYEKNSVREYWIVDSGSRDIVQFVLRKKHFVLTELGEGDTVKSSVLAGFESNVGELIGG